MSDKSYYVHLPENCVVEDASKHPSNDGVKHDDDKLKWSLVPRFAMNEIISVLMHGEKLYGAHNWMNIENLRERYYNASMRHHEAYWQGKLCDEDSGLHHLAHAICCDMFILSDELMAKSKLWSKS